MNNEPVAYVNSMCNDYIDWKIDPMSIDGQSLYTNPTKTLTDEEIKDLWCEVYDFKRYDCLTELDYKFCREIIKKAQEK